MLFKDNLRQSRMRILIVDDDDAFLETLSDLLTERGLIVDTATTGRGALQNLGGEAYDVVLIDIRLPDTSGVSLLNTIMTGNDPPGCIIVTAHQSVENAVEALNLGAEAYLVKPVEALDLFEIIERIREIRVERRKEEERRLEIEKALRDAERMALVGRVAAMMMHDIRGPMQTITNSVQLLEMAPDKGEKALEMIKNAVKKTVGMLDELRQSTQDSPPRFKTVDPADVIHEALEEAYIPASIELELLLEEGHEIIQVDPSKFRRVIENLLRNAVEAMPEGGKLSLMGETDADKFLLKISDTGVGISKEEFPKLFEPFYTTKSGGMGLGLAYCKRAIEAHGGTVEAESKVGEGTKITISMPKTLETE